jgi:hypothetical protein
VRLNRVLMSEAERRQRRRKRGGWASGGWAAGTVGQRHARLPVQGVARASDTPSRYRSAARRPSPSTGLISGRVSATKRCTMGFTFFSSAPWANRASNILPPRPLRRAVAQLVAGKVALRAAGLQNNLGA